MVLPDSNRISRAPFYSGNSPKEAYSSFAYGAVTLYGFTFQKILLPDRFVTLMCQALQPREHIAAVWATPISLPLS